MKETHYVALHHCSARNQKEFVMWVAEVKAKWERVQRARTADTSYLKRLTAMAATWALLLVLAQGCALLEPAQEFATMEECRIAHRLKQIDNERLFQCVVERLPETTF